VRGLGIGDGRDIVVTSDGQWAYLVNQHVQPSDPAAAIVLFRRDPMTGALTQLLGSAGCISTDGSSQDGPGTCQTLATLGRPFGISISSDDDFLYVTDHSTPSHLHVLARDRNTGALSEVQCLSQSPAPTGCAVGRVLGSGKSVVLSPDGRHAYSGDVSGVSVFDRDPVTGVLTQLSGAAGCVTATGNDDTGAATCASGRVLSGTEALALAPAGATLYAATDHGVAVFHVAEDGSLTQLSGADGCSSLSGSDDHGNQSCATGRGIAFPFGLALSPDGRSLYVISDNNDPADGVAIFSVDAATGTATQLPGPAGCITADGSSDGVAGACANAGPALEGIYDPTVSPDGATVYLPGYDGQTLGIYRRETGPGCQAASGVTPYQTATTVALHCIDSDGDPVAASIVTAPSHGTLLAIDQATGSVVYTPRAGYSGTDSFTFAASDGTNASNPASAAIVVASPGARRPSPTVPSGGVTRPKATPPPRLTELRLSRGTLREVRSGRSRTPLTFSFVLTEAARVTLTFTRKVTGRRVREVTLGTLVLKGRVGRNRVTFDGRLPRRGWLPLGRITVTAVATAQGHRSAARQLSFLVACRT
jgi:DNA-binding beta-propeller fold protein YncE